MDWSRARVDGEAIRTPSQWSAGRNEVMRDTEDVGDRIPLPPLPSPPPPSLLLPSLLPSLPPSLLTLQTYPLSLLQKAEMRSFS